MNAATLDEIGIKHGTDKSSRYHDYLSFYEIFLSHMRPEPIKLLEIGVFNGQSLRMWYDYFPNATIIGVDIQPSAQQHANARTLIRTADQSNLQELVDIAVELGPFDVIIEDGSHRWEHQITTLRALFPFLKPSGIYVVEDIQTSFGNLGERYKGIASISCFEYLQKLVALTVAHEQLEIRQVEDAFLRTFARQIKHISFHKHACLIQKAWKKATTAKFDKVLLGDDVHEKSLKISVLAHFSRAGDVYENGGSVHPTNGRALEIQGLALTSEVHALEYRVQFADGEWTEWSKEDDFAGTRGQSRLLLGAAVRIVEGHRAEYSARLCCLFTGSEDVVTAWDGEEATAADSRFLCGVQVDVITRAT